VDGRVTVLLAASHRQHHWGFTVLNILMVVGIAAALVALILGGFTVIMDRHQRRSQAPHPRS
jgi:Tfp pilus assembly protein FimT